MITLWVLLRDDSELPSVWEAVLLDVAIILLVLLAIG